MRERLGDCGVRRRQCILDVESEQWCLEGRKTGSVQSRSYFYIYKGVRETKVVIADDALLFKAATIRNSLRHKEDHEPNSSSDHVCRSFYASTSPFSPFA